MNEHKELLEAAAKVMGIVGEFDVGVIWYKNQFGDDVGFNPIKNAADLYRLARRRKLMIDFEFGRAWFARGDGGYSYFPFIPNDESEALAILRAAVAAGEMK